MNLSKLNELLNKKLGNEWHLLEIETLSMMIGAKFDDITFVKAILLKTLQLHPATIITDADYFLRFVEIANGNVPDPHHHDIPSSLELIFAMQELFKILGEDNVDKTNCLSNVIRYVINDEGHGEAYHGCLSKYSGKPLVTNDKTKAADEYIDCMYKGDRPCR